MAALVFFTSLFLLVALLSLTAVSGLFSGARRAGTGKKGSAKAGQATRKPRQKRQPRQASGGAAKSSRAASSSSHKAGEPRRRFRLPSISVPPGLSSCLPLGLLFALMVGAGQLALYGLQQSRREATDTRLAAFDGALDYLGVAALVLVILGLIGAIAGYRRRP